MQTLALLYHCARISGVEGAVIDTLARRPTICGYSYSRYCWQRLVWFKASDRDISKTLHICSRLIRLLNVQGLCSPDANVMTHAPSASPLCNRYTPLFCIHVVPNENGHRRVSVKGQAAAVSNGFILAATSTAY